MYSVLLDAPVEVSSEKLCQKRRFNKRDAQTFVNFAQGRRHAKHRRECRVYHCEACQCWHVTSQARFADTLDLDTFWQ